MSVGHAGHGNPAPGEAYEHEGPGETEQEPRRCPQCGLPVAFTSDHFNGSAGWTCEKAGTAVPEPRPELTPREEFESVFGPIIDDQWAWLKEFVARRYVPARGER